MKRLAWYGWVAVVCVTLVAWGTARAADWYVDRENSNPAPNGTSSNPFTNITDAVAAANANDAIYVADGVYNAAVGETFNWTVDHNLSFYGGYVGLDGGSWNSSRTPRSTIIDPNSANRVIDMTSVTLTFDGFTVRNSQVAGSAGTINCDANPSAIVHINDCVFTNCASTANNGGALHTEYGYMGGGTITTSEFVNCYGGGIGGALYFGLDTGKQMLIKDCVFRGCHQDSALGDTGTGIAIGGGAIMLMMEGGSLCEFESCTFTSNTAASVSGGGAVLVVGQQSSASTVTVKRCVFEYNTCDGSGGGAAGIGCKMGWPGFVNFYVENSLFYRNTGNAALGSRPNWTGARTFSVKHCTIAYTQTNTVWWTGMGIYTGDNYPSGTDDETLIINNCIIAHNFRFGILHEEHANPGLGPYDLTYNDVYDNYPRGYPADVGTNYWGGDNAAITAYNTTPPTGGLKVDPKFVDPDNNNFRLLSSSDCADSGTDLGITVDLVGATRPLGAGYDMGCYENNFAIGTVLLVR